MNPEIKEKDALHELELKISHFLRGGVILSGLLLLVAWLWILFEKGDVLSTFATYHPQPLWESIQWALVMNDRAYLFSLLGLGILVLMPIIRVLMTGFLFLKQKEYRLAIMAFAVFGALVASFTLGIEL